MKNKKGFISISIIYSFFIVFLLLLVLTLTMYTTNRSSFNIFTKDEKMYHAKHSVTSINSSKVSKLEATKQYYSTFYESTYEKNNTVKDRIPVYMYVSGPTVISYEKTIKPNYIFVILGPEKDYQLNYTSFQSSIAGQALKEFESASQTGTTITLVPSLNQRYNSWSSYLVSSTGQKDLIGDGTGYLSSTLIKDLVNNLKDTEGYSIKLDLTSTKLVYIGYDDGADGVLKIAGLNPVNSNVYYAIIDTSVFCTEDQCLTINKDVIRTISTNNIYGYKSKTIESASQMDETFTTLNLYTNNLINKNTLKPEKIIYNVINKLQSESGGVMWK